MKRRLTGLIAAAALAGALACPNGWTPICAAYEEGSFYWYAFFCYLPPGPPPPDPQG